MVEFNLEKGLKGVAQVVIGADNMAEKFSKPMPLPLYPMLFL